MRRTLNFFLPLLLVLSVSVCGHAQEDTTNDDIEKLFSEDDQAEDVKERQAEQEAESKQPERPPQEKPQEEIKDLTGLAKLSPFSDIAVIQRRFLPKTGRFELFGGPLAIMNDAYFSSYGFNARFGFYFKEKYGIELSAITLTTSDKDITKDLHDQKGVQASTLVTSKSFYGIDFKWTPVYGKITLMNHHITPFDLYLSGGGGVTGTNSGGSAPTVHLGVGQIFAISKSFAVRWDFSWNYFNAEVQSTVNGKTSKVTNSFSNLFLTLGASFFFPEATYR